MCVAAVRHCQCCNPRLAHGLRSIRARPNLLIRASGVVWSPAHSSTLGAGWRKTPTITKRPTLWFVGSGAVFGNGVSGQAPQGWCSDVVLPAPQPDKNVGKADDRDEHENTDSQPLGPVHQHHSPGGIRSCSLASGLLIQYRISPRNRSVAASQGNRASNPAAYSRTPWLAHMEEQAGCPPTTTPPSGVRWRRRSHGRRRSARALDGSVSRRRACRRWLRRRYLAGSPPRSGWDRVVGRQAGY